MSAVTAKYTAGEFRSLASRDLAPVFDPPTLESFSEWKHTIILSYSRT